MFKSRHAWMCFRKQTSTEEPYGSITETDSGMYSSVTTLEEERQSISSLPSRPSPYDPMESRLTQSFNDLPEAGCSNWVSTFENPLYQQVKQKEKIRLLMVGNHEVGKSCIILRYANDSFITRYNRTTLKYTHCQKKIERANYPIQFIDIGIDVAQYCNLAELDGPVDGIIMVYSVENRMSLDELNEVKRAIGQTLDLQKVPVCILGNKKDLERRNSSSAGQSLARQFNATYAEVSAKSGYGVHEAISELIVKIQRWRDSDKATSEPQTL